MHRLTGDLMLAMTTVATAVRYQFTKQKIRRLLKQRSEISIELGAGQKKGVGEWLTIDLTSQSDLYWDLRKGIPFPDKRISRIYSSHFFEHLSFPEIQQFLQECKRVLIPGGEFSICVPNARIYLEAYVKGESMDSTFFGYAPAYNNTTRIDYVNYMAYMNGEHKYMFDEENLVFILKYAGFSNVQLREFDPAIDLLERDFESIYAQGEK